MHLTIMTGPAAGTARLCGRRPSHERARQAPPWPLHAIRGPGREGAEVLVMTTCYRCQNGEPHHLIERGPVTLAICADCLRSTDISYRDICARCFREPAISPIISEATGTVYF